MAKWLKRWRRYKHPYKGDMWSKLNPYEFQQSHGSGFVVMETVKLKDFHKKNKK